MKAVIFASAFPVRAVVLGLVLAIGPVKQVSAEFIPLLGGLIDYTERVTIFDPDEGVFETGTLPNLAESVQGSAGGAFGSATNTAGTFQTPASTFVSANSNQGYRVEADTDITFDARLIRLHPDAPGDIGIPLFYTSSLSATDGAIAELNIRAGETLLQESVNGSSININSSLSVLANEYLRIEIVAGATSIQNSEIASASTPVFTIDPNFMVSFLGRTERAADLYTLAVKPEIGFAGNFETVTPFTDGCLPDPSLLTTSGTPLVRDGDTVTCLATDPSGFRSYGNDPGGTLGILNELAVVVTTDATVETSVSDTETFGILGQDNGLFNQGIVRANGENTDAIFFAGDGSEIANEGVISTSGNTSTAVFLEGDSARTLNEGEITTGGFRSSAVVLEGDDATISNRGTISTEGDQSSGLVVEGLTAFMENEGAINTIGNYSVGMTMLSIDSERLRNEGTIETSGEDAMGILALGLNHAIENLDVEATTLDEGQIKTLGARAHGIALGLQEPVIPPGVEIPAQALAAASGSITSSGFIETRGDEADAIHAFANNLPVINSGELKTSGNDAHGISIIGELAEVTNEATGNITAEGDESFAIDLVGSATEKTIVSNAGMLIGGVEEESGASPSIDAGGIRLIGPGEITNQEGSTLKAFGEAALGIRNTEAKQSVIKNLGMMTINAKISAKTAVGIDAVGDEVRLQNGKRQTSTVPDDAILEIIGDNSFGMRTAGTGAAVSNSTMLRLDGDFNKGIEVEIQGNDSYWIDNDGVIELGDGAGNIAIHLRNANVGNNIPGAPGNSDAFCTGGSTGAQVLNCGEIRLGTSSSAIGLLVEGTKESFIENQERISGTGDEQVAIAVASNSGADPGDAQLNVVTNFTDINLQDGSDMRGMLINGSGNYVFNGTGESRYEFLSVARFDDRLDGIGGSISQSLDKQRARTGGFGPAQEEQSVNSLASILVDGPNAIGLDINGIGNFIGNRADAIDDDGSIIDPNLPLDQQPGGPVGPSKILATGTGSIGVRLSGGGNVIDNVGIIAGEAYSILGGNGDDIVQNKNELQGDVDLGAGSDTFIQLGSGNNIAGTVEAGEAGGIDDLLFLASTAPITAEQSGDIDRFDLDGNKFRNFEGLKINNGDLNKFVPGAIALPQGRVYLQNDLVLDAADSGSNTISQAEIKDAEVYFENDARLEADEILVGFGGALRGNGSAGRRVFAIGQVASTILVDQGGLIGPGSSAGEFEIFGNLELGGTLEIEIFGTSNGQFDVLRVFGDLDLLDTASLEIIFSSGFAPKANDSFDFLAFDTLLGDFDLIDIAVSGLLPGFEFDLALGQDGVKFVALTDGVVPVPSAIWFFLSGMGSIWCLARRQPRTESKR